MTGLSPVRLVPCLAHEKKGCSAVAKQPFCVGGPARFAVRVRARFPANLIISVSGREPRAGIFEKSSPVAATVRARFPANPLISVFKRELRARIFEKASPAAARVRARFSANPLFSVSGRELQGGIFEKFGSSLFPRGF